MGVPAAAVAAIVFCSVDSQAQTNAVPVITAPSDKTYEQGEEITAFDVTVTDADGDDVTVTLTGLPSGLSYTSGQVQGTVASDATAQAYTVTIEADDGVNAAVTATFTVTVTAPAPSNAAPVITAPSDKTYEQGEEVTAFDVTVTDADGDDVTVTLTGLPSGLSYADGQVQGTVAADATAQAYTVTIEADDGVNTAVTATFTVTVTAPASSNTAPVITAPSDKTYEQGEEITAFDITVTDADEDTVTVEVSGLPSGLSYTSGQVQGTVAADATAQAYTVTITADDGVNTAVTATFTVTVSVKADPVGPTVTISGPSAARNGAFDVTITFSESVTGFEKADMMVGNGAVTAFSGSGASYTATITPTATGTVTVDVAADVAVDAENDGNTAASRYSVAADLDAPTVTISGPSDAQNGAFDVTITFSESVTGFEKADVAVGAGTATGFSGSGTSYTATITPTATGTVTVDVAANAALDGAGNGNTAAGQYSVQAEAAPNAAPAISAPGDKAYEQGEEVTAFDVKVTDADGDDVTVTVTGLPSGLSYADGQVQGTVAADAAAQAYTVTITADDGVNAAVTATFTVTVTAAPDAPTVTISGPSDVQNGAFDVTITFSESVTGFEKADMTVGNGAVTAFSGSGASYTATITPTATGTVTVDVPADVAVDAENDGNTAASRYSVAADLDAPTVTISGPSDAQNGAFDVTITFSESVIGDELHGHDHAHGDRDRDRGRGGGSAGWSGQRQHGGRPVGTGGGGAERGASDHGALGQDVRAGGGDHGVRHHGDGCGRRRRDGDADGPAVGAGTRRQVQGTVAADATAQAYTVTIEADDGVNTAVTTTVTVTAAPDAPTVTISGPWTCRTAPST